MQTWHLHIKGQVQGVGFRPFVFLVAQTFQVRGWVTNGVDGVHIQFNADKEKALAFQKYIVEQAPALAQITDQQLVIIPEQIFDTFQIRSSHSTGIPTCLPTPDIALCASCRRELYETQNRRFQYPFISCTNCGPRYSILQKLPYDRETTTMDPFQLCTTCLQEYDNWADRRYYSQTNSCPNCAITLSVRERQQTYQSFSSIAELIQKIINYWEAGKIIAIKGIGGFLLTADANNPIVIQELRKRKQRPTKPFALMFPSVESIDQVASLSDAEIQQLVGPTAPIILLETKARARDMLVVDLIAPQQRQLGVMLPYTPLYDLLLTTFNRPIIATSANRSSAPIIYKETSFPNELDELADVIVRHNRTIVIPQDDSVLQYSPFKKHPILYRRSRGIAPVFLNISSQAASKEVLAMGALLKSSFAFLHQGNILASQYLGDLSNYLTETNYRTTLHHLWQLVQAKPTAIVIDYHPYFPSSELGRQLAKNHELPLVKVQHHIAHFAALLGEHQLIEKTAPILGIIWDGLGVGTDEQLWGGEFFIYQQKQFERIGHLPYFPVLAGDKMAREPRLSALAATWDMEVPPSFLQEKFTTTEWAIYKQILQKSPTLQTSSIGRLFDAVAALLGLLDVQSFEGEAAMQLENKAIQYFKQHGLATAFPSFQQKKLTFNQLRKHLLSEIISDITNHKSVSYIAARFHFLLVQIIEWIATKEEVKNIGCSGGVFQNGLLVDLLQHYLSDTFELFFHQQLPPNDENISVGQVMVYSFDLKY